MLIFSIKLKINLQVSINQKEMMSLNKYLFKFILAVFFLFFVNSILLAEQKCGLIITSSPVSCEITITNIIDIDSISVKGGEFIEKSTTLVKIKKTDFQLDVNGITKGKYQILFMRDNNTIKADIDIYEGKTSLIKGNFHNRKAFIIPQVYIGNDGAPMIFVPAGIFEMGSDIGDIDETPVHKVYLDEFYIDVYEVTNAQYKRFIEATGHPKPLYWDNPKCNAPDQPVVGVTWQDALEYCRWAGKRLPTEAEWEKSARGGLSEGEPISEDDEDQSMVSQENPGLESAYPVGFFSPNAYGLHDMERNAWEWCHDWYNEDYYAKSPEKNPQGPDLGEEKVLRGGSWFSGIYTTLPPSYRYRFDPQKTSILIGFRCLSRKANP
jgi:iron(II)-dependent oxidoreductase